MKNILIGEVWESFFVEQHKMGFLHRVTNLTEDHSLFTTQLHVVYGTAIFQHSYTFHNKVNYPSHSYVFDTNDGAPIHVRFAKQQIICQVDDDVFNVTIPNNARPAYGSYPLIVTIPFETGFRQSFAQIEDASGTVYGDVELISAGWNTLTLDGRGIQLWQVEEWVNQRLINRYWLDDSRRIRLTHWQGAKSYRVSTKEEAVANLPSTIRAYAEQLSTKHNHHDWMQDIENWLDNGKL